MSINDFIFIASLLMPVNKEGSGVLQFKFLAFFWQYFGGF